VGGLVGLKTGAAIRNSYAAGEVSGTGGATVGGLVGETSGNVTVTYGYYAADAGVVECADDDEDCAAAADVLVARGVGTPKRGVDMKSDEFVSLLNVAAYALKNNTFKENTNKWYALSGEYPKLSMDSVTISVFATCFAGGNGTEAAPYQIGTSQHLENLAVYVNCGADLSKNGFFTLTNDILLNDTLNWREWGTNAIKRPKKEWTAIGQQPSDTAGQPKVRFNGTFNGAGYTIYGVFIDKGEDSTFSGRYQGLFGRVEKEGTGTSSGAIKNLGVSHSYIRGYCYVGGLAGLNKKGTITKSFVKNANIEAWGGKNGAGGIGGLVGLNDSTALVINSYSWANVSGEINMAGGLVGWNSANSRISYSYAIGNVSVSGDDVGGLAGRNDGSVIRDSYANGNVVGVEATAGTGGNGVGGLVGINFNAVIAKCYAVGAVSGNSSYGGLVGLRMSNGRIDSSYYSRDITPVKNDYGTPKTEGELKSLKTYAGWDTIKVWAIDSESDGYPYLGMTRPELPKILTHPTGADVRIGQNYPMSVSATASSGTPSYQWFSNTKNSNEGGARISGATDRSYTVKWEKDTTLYYYVVVTNTQTTPVADSVAGSQTVSVTSNTAKVNVGKGSALLSDDRVVPQSGFGKESAAISPPPALTTELTVGPNPTNRSIGAVSIFREGKRIDKGELRIYDAMGNAVKKISVVDDSSGKLKRKVAAWDLTDAEGRYVPEGAYLLKGVVVTDGKHEKVSLIVGIVK